MANPNSAKYPTALPTATDLLIATNGAFTTLSAAVNNSTNSIPVTETFYVPCIIRVDEEAILCPTITGSNYTGVTRGYAGTVATSHVDASQVYGFVEATHHNQLVAEVIALTTALGISLGNVLSTSTAFGGDVSGTAAAITVSQVGGVSASTIGNIASGYSRIRNESPTGTINGSNTAFTLSNTPISGSVLLWLNGTLKKPTTDFTVSGVTVTFTVAPSGSDWIYVLYRTLT